MRAKPKGRTPPEADHPSPLAPGEGGGALTRELSEAQAALAEAEAARQQLTLLADMGRVLSSALDTREILESLADLTVPTLADYCIVDMFNAAGEPERAVAVHQDPAQRETMLELQRRFPPKVGAAHGMGVVMRTGEPIFASQVTLEDLRRGAQNEEHFRLLSRLGCTSYVLVPLVSRGRVLGALGLARTDDARPYGPADLAFAQELAGRAAVAVDSAQHNEALRASERRVRNLIDTAAEGVWMTDAKGDTIYVNQRMAEMLGRSTEEIVGLSSWSFFDPASIPAANLGWERCQQGMREQHDLLFRRQDGSPLWARVSTSPILDEQGRFNGLLGMVTDVTERRRLDEELQRRVEELADADQRKDEFLAMLSHELRNPLAAISNACHALREREAGNPRSADLLAMVSRQVRHLARLVDDLLDVSRFTRGLTELRTGRIELASAIAGAVETTRSMIEARGLTLLVTPADEPLWLEADSTRIEQILSNLLNNAAKFTEPGGSIEIAAERQGGEAVLRVKDSGAGIAPDLLPHVFDLFVQGERSLDRSHGGLGIGLTLVRNLVERHGGKVEAASGGPGRGSTLTVRLPLALPEEPGSHAPVGRQEAPRAAGTRVLLVEDNLDSADALAELLRAWGYEVAIANDGAAALQAAQFSRPEIVLLDIGLPGMDGYEVAREMRRLAGFESVLIVALTGYGQEADRRRSKLAGFNHHLVKPVDLEQLRRLLAGEHAYS